MATDEQKNKVMSFLKGQTFGHLATVSQDSIPQVALVSYLVEDDWKFCILTKCDSRKAVNLAHNNSVSFVVDDIESMITVQMAGTASAMTNPIEKLEVVKKMSHEIYANSFFLTPLLKMGQAGLMALCLEISWVKWSHFGADQPTEIYEFTL